MVACILLLYRKRYARRLIALLGSPESEAETLALVTDGNRGVLMCLKRWATDRVWRNFR